MTHMLKRYGLLLLLLTTIQASLFAQGPASGTIKGFVYDRSSGSEPVIYTNVFLRGTKYGVQTDLDGYFSLTQIPPGDYILSTTQLGYDTAKRQYQHRRQPGNHAEAIHPPQRYRAERCAGERPQDGAQDARKTLALPPLRPPK